MQSKSIALDCKVISIISWVDINFFADHAHLFINLLERCQGIVGLLDYALEFAEF